MKDYKDRPINGKIPEKPRAILAGVCLAGDKGHPRAMEELRGLAGACGLETVATLVQNAQAATHATFMGSGKVEELKRLVETLDADIVIFNEQLAPMQMRNLEKELDTEVLDRTGLILQIFASRARTREAKLQVESARLQYMLPRLVGLRAELSRQGGGSGRLSNKGAGEQKLELDRRRIEKRIAELDRELELVERERNTQRSRRMRGGLTRVALVGYTNAGKSTVMNALLDYCGRPKGSSLTGTTGNISPRNAGSRAEENFSASARKTEDFLGTRWGRAGESSALSARETEEFFGTRRERAGDPPRTDFPGGASSSEPEAGRESAGAEAEGTKKVFAADMPFATLDTSVRRISAPGHLPFLLSDTVGFVSDLPHSLVKAFRSTLDEVRCADLLLEVVDFSDPEYRQQIEVTAKTLDEIGAGHIPVAFLYNKTDRVSGMDSAFGESGKDRPSPSSIPFRRGNILFLAAGKGIGIPEILCLIEDSLEERTVNSEFLIPYPKGGLLQRIRQSCALQSEEYLPEGIRVRALCREEDARHLKALLSQG